MHKKLLIAIGVALTLCITAGFTLESNVKSTQSSIRMIPTTTVQPDTAKIVGAIEAVQDQHRVYQGYGISHLKGKSTVAPFLAPTGIKILDWFPKRTYVLSGYRTKKLKSWFDKNGARFSLLSSAAVTGACALLASPGTALASAIAGGMCFTFMMFYGAALEDALNSLSKKYACLRINMYTIGSQKLLTFGRTRCVK